MSTGYYLIDHPNPNKTQYRTSRRAKPSGAIVLHTPEAGLDTKPPDTKAEDVLRFISRRDSYGSYHGGSDSDSIELGAPWDHEVWGSSARSPRADQVDDNGERLRSNSIAIHLFVACDHDDWVNAPIAWVTEAIQRLAILAANAADWLASEHGILVPARLGTEAEFWDLRPGFYYHAAIQPANRKDPGQDFPLELFLDEYAQAAGHLSPPVGGLVERIQAAVNATGYTIDLDGVLDERAAAAVENMAEGIARLLAEARTHEIALAQAEQARVDAVSRAIELDQQLAEAVALRAEMHDRNVTLERFLGRMASTWHRVDQLGNEVAEIVETAHQYVDDATTRSSDG